MFYQTILNICLSVNIRKKGERNNSMFTIIFQLKCSLQWPTNTWLPPSPSLSQLSLSPPHSVPQLNQNAGSSSFQHNIFIAAGHTASNLLPACSCFIYSLTFFKFESSITLLCTEYLCPLPKFMLKAGFLIQWCWETEPFQCD